MANLLYGLRASVSRASFVRAVRYAWKHPGLSADIAANLDVVGSFSYGQHTRISEGSHLLVPRGASLSIGNNCHIGRHVEIGPGGKISIGDDASIQDRCILVGDVELGRYSILSLNVLMTSGHHYYDRWPYLTIRDQDDLVAGDAQLAASHSRPIVVGEDCWFGMNSVVMRGVSVGRGCVVGSNSVVTRSIEPYSVVAGVPAKLLKKRLQFVPPERICWSQQDQMPYFYSGFQLTRSERLRNAGLGGHIARANFSIWLADGPSKIRLRIRSCGQSSISTLTDPDVHPLTIAWEDLVLERTTSRAPLAFRVEGDPVALSDASLA